MSNFAYDLGMSLDRYIDDCLSRGRAFFSRDDVLTGLELKPEALSAAITRLIKSRRLANPRHGFYLILRPEDWNAGAPDPAKWIDPLMKHQGIDYRISLLRAAAFHGSSHQAAMVFQVVVPTQLRDFEIGRHRLQFLYQAPEVFALTNRSEYLQALKTEAGYAKLAGLEVTLLDCIRYFHKVGGINAVAQIVKDIGGKADPRLLGRFRSVYENTSLRRLGYLLDFFGHQRQAKALEPCLNKAKTAAPLDPSSKPLLPALAKEWPRESKWKLMLNEPVEIDS
jgi:predicted transcriptional regulator of viral defense system